SPQQAQGQNPDPRDDVHALGVIWYQLVTGDLKMQAVPPDWREVAEEHGLGEEQARLLALCMASRAEKRPTDARELGSRLAVLLKSTVEVPVPGEWLARPADGTEAMRTLVRRTPGKVSVQVQEVYHLSVEDVRTDSELAFLDQFRHSAGLESLALESCE